MTIIDTERDIAMTTEIDRITLANHFDYADHADARLREAYRFQQAIEVADLKEAVTDARHALIRAAEELTGLDRDQNRSELFELLRTLLDDDEERGFAEFDELVHLHTR